MNKAILILVAGLAVVLLSAVLIPTVLQARPAELSPAGIVASAPDALEPQSVLRQQGPRRDPEGPDDIAYDDGDPQLINIPRNYWCRVRFTPTQTFEMRAVKIYLSNPNDVDDPQCEIRVYQENQDTHSLTDIVWEGEVDPVMQDWTTVEFADDEYVTFEADTSFSIVFGKVPGGDPRQGAQGWWNLIDNSAADEARSYIFVGANPPTRHRDWTTDGTIVNNDGDPIDILVRANGEYMGDVMDLTLDMLYAKDQDDNRQWTAIVGQERTFVTNLYNPRAEVAGYDLWFVVTDDGGDTVYTYNSVDIDGFAAGEELLIETDAWEPEETGRYTVTVSVSLLEGVDVNPADNELVLEQIVVDPANEPEQWWGYVDEEYEPELAYLDSDGYFYGQLYYFPGGDTPFRLNNFRAMLKVPTANIDLTFQVLSMDFNGPDWEVVYETQASANETGDEVWVEVPIPDDELIVMDDTHGIIVGYLVYNTPGDEDLQFNLHFDTTPPITGARIDDMPAVNLHSDDVNANLYTIPGGEWMFEIQVEPTAPHGALLQVLPDPLDFGYGLPFGEPATLPAQFINYGDEPVNVSAINLGPVASRFFSLGETSFDVAGGETLSVDVTFNADTLIDLNTNFLVVSDAENWQNGRYSWPIHASNMNTVLKADVDEIDFGDNLNIGTDYTVDVTFTNPALLVINVSEIRIPEEYQDILTVDPQSFEVFPGEEVVCHLTLNTPQPMELLTEITIVNNSQNAPEMVLEVRASVMVVSEDGSRAMPQGWSLSQNRPNPFNPTTTVDFATLKGSKVDLAVYDMSGRRVLDVFHGYLSAGYHSVELNGLNLPAGVYLYRLATAEFTAARKMVLMK